MCIVNTQYLLNVGWLGSTEADVTGLQKLRAKMCTKLDKHRRPRWDSRICVTRFLALIQQLLCNLDNAVWLTCLQHVPKSSPGLHRSPWLPTRSWPSPPSSSRSSHIHPSPDTWDRSELRLVHRKHQLLFKVEKETVKLKVYFLPGDTRAQWAAQRALGNVLWAFCICIYWAPYRTRRSIGQSAADMNSTSISSRVIEKNNCVHLKISHASHVLVPLLLPAATSWHSLRWILHGCPGPLWPSKWRSQCVRLTRRTYQAPRGRSDQSKHRWWLQSTRKKHSVYSHWTRVHF